MLEMHTKSHTCVSGMSVRKLENDNVVCRHAAVVEPSVTLAVLHLIHLVGKVRVDNVHGHQVAGINCASITESKGCVLSVW